MPVGVTINFSVTGNSNSSVKTDRTRKQPNRAEYYYSARVNNFLHVFQQVDELAQKAR
jgi:hypothetical protein